MAKNELSNAVTLAKVQIKNYRGIIGLSAALFVIFVVGLITAIEVVLSYTDHINHATITDNFVMLITAFIMGVTYLNFVYRSYNGDYAVYPQTNNSRFFASQIITYIIVFLVPLGIMLIYLIQYAILALIAHGRDNVHLVFDFNIWFVLSGFVVAIIYLALIAGVITLISTLIRKFRLYAAVFFTTLAIVLFGSVREPFQLLFRLLSFLLEEPNIWLFILKGIGTWVVLFIAAFLINKYTVYYKAHSFNIGKRVVAATCAATIMVAVLVIGLIGMNEVVASFEPTDEPSPWDVFWDVHTNVLEIDLSDVPAGSDINVVTSGDATFIDGLDSELMWVSHSFPPNGQTTFHFTDGTELTFPFGHLFIIDGEQLHNIDGNTLFVQYHYPVQVIQSGVLISHLMNPQLDIRFEGTTLYVNYTYDRNQKAIVIPVWSFMRQFDSFRGQNVFNESLIWNTWTDVQLWLWVE